MSPEYDNRIRSLQQKMRDEQIDLTAIAPSANMVYLTGFAPHLDERPTALLITPDDLAFVVPALNAEQVEANTPYKPIRWADSDGARGAFETAYEQLGRPAIGTMAVDNTMRADYLLLIADVVTPRRSVTAESVMGALRLLKSAEEMRLMKESALLADRAMLAGFEALRPGMTEREMAELITGFFKKNGAESADFAIIGSGPNGAFPHHSFSERVINAGDVIVMDIGGTLNKYKSDITRCFFLGEPDEQVLRIYDIVRRANEAGRKVVKPGIKASEVDDATRRVITQEGYGPEFTHRTGHGIGMETHEPPWISSSSETVLQAGMAFSVEPGIYLNGRFGIRVEDIVVVTEEGCETLSELPRDLCIKPV